MMLINICFCIMTFFNNTTPDQADIIIAGKAENLALGACVISKATGIGYFVEGLREWDEKTLGKYVKVSGKLKVERIVERQHEPGRVLYQRISSPVMRTIQRPKWKLLKSGI